MGSGYIWIQILLILPDFLFFFPLKFTLTPKLIFFKFTLTKGLIK
jgi:hypothetical protein